MTERKPGLDIIRILGLLFVNGIHFFLYNGFYSARQEGASLLVANTARWLFYGCNCLFMILTGYLKCHKTLSKRYYRSIVPILIGYFLYCAIAFPIYHFLLNDPQTFGGWLDRMVTFGNYAWYLEMYIGLFMIAPFLNLAINGLKTKAQLLWLNVTMISVTILYTVSTLNVLPDYWGAMYPITCYVVGATIRKLDLKLHPLLGIGGSLLSALFLGLLTIFTTEDREVFNDGYTVGYGGIYVVIMMAFLVIGLHHVKLGRRTSKVLAFFSGGVLEGYMLSRLWDVWVYYKFPQWRNPEHWLLLFVAVTIPIFLTSLIAGKGVHTVSGLLTKLILPKGKKPAPTETTPAPDAQTVTTEV